MAFRALQRAPQWMPVSARLGVALALTQQTRYMHSTKEKQTGANTTKKKTDVCVWEPIERMTRTAPKRRWLLADRGTIPLRTSTNPLGQLHLWHGPRNGAHEKRMVINNNT